MSGRVDSGERRRPRVKPYPLRELPRLLRVQVELARVFWRHLSPILDASSAAGGPGWERLEAALGGTVTLRAREPYLFPLEGAATRVRGGMAIELELLTPSARRAVLALDEGLHDCLAGRLAPRSLLWLLRESLRPAPVRVVDYCLPDEVPDILSGPSEAGRQGTQTPAQALALDLEVETPDGAGWARLLAGADLRLSSPPPPSSEGPGLLRLWQRGIAWRRCPPPCVSRPGMASCLPRRSQPCPGATWWCWTASGRGRWWAGRCSSVWWAAAAASGRTWTARG